MYYIYVLKSHKNNKKYVGFTGKTPQQRLKEHNAGSNVFTRHNGPFDLIYWEEYNDQLSARKREKFLKSGSGREFLRRKLQEKINQDLVPVAQLDRASAF